LSKLSQKDRVPVGVFMNYSVLGLISYFSCHYYLKSRYEICRAFPSMYTHAPGSLRYTIFQLQNWLGKSIPHTIVVRTFVAKIKCVKVRALFEKNKVR